MVSSQIESQKTRPDLKSRTNIIIDWLMGLCCVFLALSSVIEMSVRLHCALGTLVTVLVLMHLVQHRKWFRALAKGKWTMKRKKISAPILLAGVAMVFLLVTGWLAPEPAAYSLDEAALVGLAKVHHVGSYVCCAFFLVHAFLKARTKISHRKK